MHYIERCRNKRDVGANGIGVSATHGTAVLTVTRFPFLLQGLMLILPFSLLPTLSSLYSSTVLSIKSDPPPPKIKIMIIKKGNQRDLASTSKILKLLGLGITLMLLQF